MLRGHTFVRANTRQTLARFRALLGALVIGIASLVASAAVVGDMVAADASSLDESSGLSTVELLSVSPSGEPRPLTPAALAQIRTMPGVQAVVGGGSLGTSLTFRGGGDARAASAAEEGFADVFWATARFTWSQPPVVTSETGRPAGDDLTAGEVLLPDRLREVDLSPLVGSEVEIEYIRGVGDQQGVAATMPVRVVGVYDNADPRRDGESALYVSESDFDIMFAALLGSARPTPPATASYHSCLIKAATIADADRVARELTRQGFYVSTFVGEQSLPRVLGLLERVNMVIAGVLCVFGLGIGMTLAGTWSHLRRWDIGVLTSLGWSTREILRAYVTELTIVGLMVGGAAAASGTLLSLVLGLVSHRYPIWGLQQPQLIASPPASWLLGAVISVPLALALGALPRLLRLTRTEPDDALRRSD